MTSLSVYIKREIKKLIFQKLPLPDSLKGKIKVYGYVDRILFSSEEVRMAEENKSIISELLIKKRNELPSIYKQIESKITDELSKIGAKEFENEKQDMLFSYFAYGYTPNEYACYGFIDKTLEQRRTFVSDRESVKYAYRLNKCSAMDFFKDKSKTYVMFKRYYKRDLITIENKKDFDKFICFIEKNDVFVKKNDKESCGRGVELVHTHNSEVENSKLFERFLDEIKRTGEKIILEELVHQSDVMAKFNESSVNTIRCITLKTNEGVITPFCFMKVGRKGTFVDNGGAGGLLIGINEENGTLNSDAIDEFGIKYQKHPDTGIRFKGCKLPDWEQMIAICIEMADKFDSAKWIGWDMAHTDKGWVVIEANGATEVIGPQATNGVGIRERLDDHLKNTKVLF